MLQVKAHVIPSFILLFLASPTIPGAMLDFVLFAATAIIGMLLLLFFAMKDSSEVFLYIDIAIGICLYFLLLKKSDRHLISQVLHYMQ